MKHLEIERKFLLPPCSPKKFLKKEGIAYRKVTIEQFYLQSSEAGIERYRRIGKRYVHTRKSGSGLVREEREEPIDKKRYLAALRQNQGGILRKTRYIFRLGKLEGELDHFKGPLEGLNILEVEFPDEKQARTFRLPKPFTKLSLCDVTENPRFTNGSLARQMRLPAIETDLASLREPIDRLGEELLNASFALSFHPYESTAHVLKTLIYAMLRSLEANRSAILSGDRDPERLHQFRVALRKLRALLAQTKGLFAPDWLAIHRPALAEIMRSTSQKRDLDVALEHIEVYRAMIPEDYHPGLERLRSYLQEREEALRQSLEASLRSASLETEFQALMDFALSDSMEGLDEEKGRLPVLFPVKERLKRRYRRVLHKGAKLDRDSEAAEYHQERIEVKKLRYLMEFFAPIFEEKSYRRLLRELKKIQTTLGDHQDLEVQREELLTFASSPELQDPEVQKTLSELRKIMKKLAQKKRKEFQKAFRSFRKKERTLHRLICRF
jgi:CHAD domain-containing protein/CYTH domain-containing protein